MRVALITPDRAYHPFVAMIVEGLRARGDEFFASDPGNGLQPYEVLEHEAGWLLAAEAADAVLVFFGKAGSLAAGEPPTREPKYHLLDELDRSPDTVCAYLDYSEMTATGRPMPGQVEAMKLDPKLRRGEPWFNKWALENCNYYFKREFYPEDPFGVTTVNLEARTARHTSMSQLAFGMLGEYERPVPRQGKDWDLFCCFGHTLTGLRKEVVEECQRLKALYRGKKIVIRNRLSTREYHECLARSKVVVDAWGHGDHCYRLWEAAAAQACVLYQRYQVLTGPEWFEEGEEAVSYSTVKEFRMKAEALLELPRQTLDIGLRGYKKAKAHHTGQARVEYVLRTMGVL